MLGFVSGGYLEADPLSSIKSNVSIQRTIDQSNNITDIGFFQSLSSSPTVRLCVRASVSNMESDVYIQPRKSFEGEC